MHQTGKNHDDYENSVILPFATPIFGTWNLELGISEREFRRDMSGQETPPVVALVEKQSNRVAFVEAQLELHAVLADREALRGGLAEQELRAGFGHGGLADVAVEGFVVRSGELRIAGQE